MRAARSLRSLVVLGFVAAAGACSPAAVSPGVATSPARTPSPSVAVPATGPASATTSGPAASDAVAIDRELLAMLPGEVGGAVLIESPDGEGKATADPLLPQVATRVAAGLAVEGGGANWVYAVVVALRPGVMSDAGFRDWRDSFDMGACSQAGGVAGHAEASLGGRTVFIGSCAGGLHTYHVWLPRLDRLVSASAVGERRFGEILMAAIRE